MILCMKTEILKISDLASDMEKISQAAAVVQGGGLVAFPTETVYGIACLAEKAPLDRLDEAKGRTPDKRYTLHIAGVSDLDRYIPAMSAKAEKLIRSAWPGPLTIVFEPGGDSLLNLSETLPSETYESLYIGGTIGVRCPDNPVAKALLERVDGAVVAPSANLTGSEPATNAKQVIAELDGRVDMIIDADDAYVCKYNQSSTVVKMGAGKIDVLREGVIKKEEIESMSSIQICFVCTGNTCRSPMAEIFFKKYLAENLHCDVDELILLGYKVTSAAMMNACQTPASAEVIDICGEKGIDATAHRSSTLGRYDVKQSDFIFVMTQGHREHLLQLWPDAAAKCMLLDEPNDVLDPIGAGKEMYSACAKQIEQAVKKRLCEILK